MKEFLNHCTYLHFFQRTIYEPPESFVNVETKKKEDRSQKMIEKPFKSFISIYLKDSYYMVNPVPRHLERDATIPYSLQVGEISSMFKVSRSKFGLFLKL